MIPQHRTELAESSCIAARHSKADALSQPCQAKCVCVCVCGESPSGVDVPERAL